MPIEAVIFDIGGVLEIDPVTGWPERWEARVGMNPGVFERLMSVVANRRCAGR